jgi:hypothetical protein
VFNQTLDPEVDFGWIPSSTWRSFDLLEQKVNPPGKPGFLDIVPVMSATVLGLDMLLQEPYIDLRMASELVLSDVGATIKILRLIGREYENVAERPSRMGDCIASLDVNVWFGAISSRSFASDRRHKATTEVWKHSRLVAQYAQLVAESLEGISPEDAYMVGLLHGIGEIPAALGWPYGDRGCRDQGALFEIERTLPLFVLNAMHSMSDSSASSVWRFILKSAHELAGARADFESRASRGVSTLAINAH